MNPRVERYRLAITVFDDPESVWGTVTALLAKDFALEQLCLVALTTTMARVGLSERIGEADRDRLSALYDQVEDWPGAGDGQAIVASSGPLLSSLLQAQSAGNGGRTQDRISAEHRSELVDQIRQGAIALVVSAATPTQQWLSTRTLLDQSLHSVKTYEFAVPPACEHPRRG